MSEPISTKEELAKALAEKDKAIVMFYASWCPFSRKFLPIFKKQAETNKELYLHVMLDEMEDIADKYDISVYPTLLYFEKGKVSKRADAEAGVGLNEKQLAEFLGACKVK